jgi:hypothetical protein
MNTIMNACVGRILAILAVCSVLAPMSSGHCGHYVVEYPQCQPLEYVFCDGNFTKCGNSTAGLAGNCTSETCNPMADDVIMALNGTDDMSGMHMEDDHTDMGGNHTETSATSAGVGGLDKAAIAVGAIGVVGCLFMSS